MQHRISVRNRVYAIFEKRDNYLNIDQLSELFIPVKGWISGSVSNAHVNGTVRDKNKAGKSRNDPIKMLPKTDNLVSCDSGMNRSRQLVPRRR